ncbi:MAG: hypothetical protein AAF430_22725 [Myxococcota bacterium]
MSGLARRLGFSLSLVGALVFVCPAFAAIVEFDSTYRHGFGDGGDPGTADLGLNGLPACNQGIRPHLNASIPGHGFAELGSGSPASLMALRPLRYGSAGPTTGNLTVMAKPGVAGINGMARYHPSTCQAVFTPSVLTPPVTRETLIDRFTGPAQYTISTSTTPLGGKLFMTGPETEMHTLAPLRGPGNWTFMVPTTFATSMQTARIVGGANRFGGGWRASGGGMRQTDILVAPGFVIRLGWASGPHMAGHGRSVPTQFVSQTGMFTALASGGMAPMRARWWYAPFTTGTVWAEDRGGQFVTIRSEMGFDNRTGPNSSMGSLLLVSPWVANIVGFGGFAGNPVHFGGTASLRFEFLPQPDASASLLAGALVVLALHFGLRRRDRGGDRR